MKKKEIKKIAYSSVVGDLFHYGHLHSILFARSIADYLVCGVLSDEAVESYRMRPIANTEERLAVISALRSADRAIVQESTDPTANLRAIHEEYPDAEILLVHGSDWEKVPGADYIHEIGGRVVKHPYYLRLSNFKIINRILENKDHIKDIVRLESLISPGGIKSAEDIRNKVIVSSKADTLKTLGKLLHNSRIEKLLDFTVAEWQMDRGALLASVRKNFDSEVVVVRSSAVNEDTIEGSNAGCFESVLDVPSGNEKAVENAIERVIGSYRLKGVVSGNNQVLIQKQTVDVAMSGVIFTRTLDTNAPYYVINYDDESSKTDTVTKGIEGNRLIISKTAPLGQLDQKFKDLILAVQEIENLMPDFGLDIEFAINKQGKVVIFQARPLTISLREKTDDEKLRNRTEDLKSKFRDLIRPRAHLAGDITYFADMPDWNPAEIIGDKPNPLAFSLYSYLITDEIWHQARTSQGYYNVAPASLVVLFGSKPYVDVRNTFNSFTPANINPDLRKKLVSFYMEELKHFPYLQDKVEFEILHTCYDLTFEERTKVRLAEFSAGEITELKKALLDLTYTLVISSEKVIQEDMKAVQHLSLAHLNPIRKELLRHSGVPEALKQIKVLLDECRRNGTLQFSRLARLAFIGKILLKSLLTKGVITDDFYHGFLGSVRTIATEISEDATRLSRGELNAKQFLKKYGHLRPGTYDITSMPYESHAELFEMPVKSESISGSGQKNPKFQLTSAELQRITDNLKQHGLEFDGEKLLKFCREALEAREYSKFEFTKSVSEALELIAEVGRHLGFNREEMGCLTVEEILGAAGLRDEEIRAQWKERVLKAEQERAIDEKITLPPILFSEADFEIIRNYESRPNYITAKVAEGELLPIHKTSHGTAPQLEGKIVLIESGDPGYDWIFMKNPAGLITKYGGVASHMAIRCAELGIPAAIGCGTLFDGLKTAHFVVLDCHLKKITPIR